MYANMDLFHTVQSVKCSLCGEICYSIQVFLSILYSCVSFVHWTIFFQSSNTSIIMLGYLYLGSQRYCYINMVSVNMCWSSSTLSLVWYELLFYTTIRIYASSNGKSYVACEIYQRNRNEKIPVNLAEKKSIKCISNLYQNRSGSIKYQIILIKLQNFSLICNSLFLVVTMYFIYPVGTVRLT